MAESPHAPTQEGPPPTQGAPVAKALLAVYAEHFELVWRFSAQRGVAASDLDVVVREVFTLVHAELPSLASEAIPRRWIAAITRHAVRRNLRKRAAATRAAPLEPETEASLDEFGPPEKLEKMSAAELVELVLEKMSALQREAFILCEMEGFSSEEAAEALGMNDAAFATRLDDARTVFNAVSARLRAQRFWIGRGEGSAP